MGYTVFERKVTRVGTPTVSISKLGRIMFNKTAAEIIKEAGAQNVHLLWDADSRKFAIRPIFTKPDSRSYMVRYGNGSALSGANVNSKTFLDYIGIDYSETRTYAATWNAKEMLLEVELPDESFRTPRSTKVAPPSVTNRPRSRVTR